MTTVLVLDYGSGNLRSACRAVEAAGAAVLLSASAADAARADALLVPGVGAFAACMRGLVEVGGDDLIRSHLARERPVLGVCVGHQVLFEGGVEHGVDAAGLGILPGRVVGLPTRRLPHMGWNVVRAASDTRLLAGLDGERFYFVHSYGVLVPGVPGPGESTTAHEGAVVVAAMERGLVSSTQFHPEKSGRAGHELLVNWLQDGGSERD